MNRVDYKSPQEYYDNLSQKLILDYLRGNTRLELAIKFVLNNIPSGSSRILDFGCGIGWSSNEIARHFRNSKIIGTDLSDKSIFIAKGLFRNQQLQFNLAKHNDFQIDEKNFDVVVLLDVYEHIKIQDRRRFHSFINSILSENGIILMSCPTPAYQAYLRKNIPDKLQPVDEDVTKENLKIFANEIGGDLIDYQVISVWNKSDYFHSIITRNELLFNKTKRLEYNTLENYYSRAKRVKKLSKNVILDQQIIRKADQLDNTLNEIKYHLKRIFNIL
jgi:2-polyprenyl-3-methyl-5-hydroxy-6-metoxy-1,4-benzoquinol methylase